LWQGIIVASKVSGETIEENSFSTKVKEVSFMLCRRKSGKIRIFRALSSDFVFRGQNRQKMLVYFLIFFAL